MDPDRSRRGEGWTCARAEDVVQDALDARRPRGAWDPWLLAHLAGCGSCREEARALLELDRVARGAGRELGLWIADLRDAARRTTAPLEGAGALALAVVGSRRSGLAPGVGRAAAAVACGLFVWFGAVPILRRGCAGGPADTAPAARSAEVVRTDRSRDTLGTALLRRRQVLRELRS